MDVLACHTNQPHFSSPRPAHLEAASSAVWVLALFSNVSKNLGDVFASDLVGGAETTEDLTRPSVLALQ